MVQLCAIHWAEQRKRYQARRGASLRTYLKRVTEHKLIDLWRQLHTASRSHENQARSLYEPAWPSQTQTLGDIVPDGEPRHDPEQVLRQKLVGAAIQRALARLTARQRQLVHGLENATSMTDLSRELGVSRDTLYAERRRIRDVFNEELSRGEV